MAPRTPSQRANDLFAAYVAIEDAQRRLDAEGNGWAAEALSSAAIAAHDKLMAEPDHSGNADMIAGRIIAHFMMTYPWPPKPGADWSDEDRAIALPVLAATAGRTTGTVRRHARIALAAIGIDLGEEEPDPLLALVTDYWTALTAYNAASGTAAEDDPALKAAWEAPYDRLCTDPPAATSEAGAIAAVRLLVQENDLNDGGEEFIAKLLPAALAFFDGRA